jgi:hypothetical protein
MTTLVVPRFCASKLACCTLIRCKLQEMHKNALLSTQRTRILYVARKKKIELVIAILTCVARNRCVNAVAKRARDYLG